MHLLHCFLLLASCLRNLVAADNTMNVTVTAVTTAMSVATTMTSSMETTTNAQITTFPEVTTSEPSQMASPSTITTQANPSDDTSPQTSTSYKATTSSPLTKATSSNAKSSTSGSTKNMSISPKLHLALGIWTITFTLMLLPPPPATLLEFLIIAITCITSWILLYLDTLLVILQDPQYYFRIWLARVKIGLFQFKNDRQFHYHLIRNDLLNQYTTDPTSSFPTSSIHSSIPTPTTVHTSTTSTHTIGRHNPTRMNPLFKQTILKNLQKRNLRDYLGNTSDFVLERFSGESPSGEMRKLNEFEGELYSSDEEVDTSPLVGRVAAMRAQRGERPGKGVANMGSGETVVEEGLSPREKVSGFISWDALKRDDAVQKHDGGEEEVVQAEQSEGSEGIERHESRESGESWVKEALGAAI